jgi:hypothetical protein
MFGRSVPQRAHATTLIAQIRTRLAKAAGHCSSGTMEWLVMGERGARDSFVFAAVGSTSYSDNQSGQACRIFSRGFLTSPKEALHV